MYDTLLQQVAGDCGAPATLLLSLRCRARAWRCAVQHLGWDSGAGIICGCGARATRRLSWNGSKWEAQDRRTRAVAEAVLDGILD